MNTTTATAGSAVITDPPAARQPAPVQRLEDARRLARWRRQRHLQGFSRNPLSRTPGAVRSTVSQYDKGPSKCGSCLEAVEPGFSLRCHRQFHTEANEG